MSTDNEIVLRSVKDPDAFTEIFERHARVIAGFAARRIGVDGADDIVSETFLIAFKRRSSFDSRWESARPWLLGIASRLIRKQREREVRHLRSLDAAAGSFDHEAPEATDAAAGRIDAQAAVRDLGPQIAALHPRDRETLFLAAWGDLTVAEIAVALGVPAGTVKSRMNRIRRQLAPAPGDSSVRLSPFNAKEVPSWTS